MMREDEGTAAHLWQLSVVAQVVGIVIIAARWIPRNGKLAAVMFALQALAIMAAALALYLAEYGYLS